MVLFLQTPEAYASVGAMTHSFIKAVESEPCGVTYGRLLTSMKAIMTNGGGSCNLQGPIGAPVSKIANFSGVQVRHSPSQLPCVIVLFFPLPLKWNLELFLTNCGCSCVAGA